MGSMYDTIKSLPLFYGINDDQVSRLVARTHFHFSRYAEGEEIITQGETTDKVKVLLSGKIRLTHRIGSEAVTVEEICLPGRMIGAERLFGINNRSPFKAEAAAETGIMSFSKEEYLTLLHSETIYMVNYINLLAARAQRPLDIILGRRFSSLTDYIACWLQILTEPKSESYGIKATLSGLNRITGIGKEELETRINELTREGLISYDGLLMTIHDRRRIIELQK